MDRTVERYIETVCPVEPSPPLDPASRLARLAPEFPELAADTLLNPNLRGELVRTIRGAVGRLEASFTGSMSDEGRKNCCRTLLEIAFNMIGLESEKAGFSEEEREEALKEVLSVLRECESIPQGREALKAAISEILSEMKKVMLGESMVARMAEEIESSLDESGLAESFVEAAKKQIQGNVYYQMSKGGYTKLGNDSATGLRRVRHLGFVQVSSNPVIAARAYEEFPELWDNFRKVVEVNPHWREDPERYADEIALHGTITSLLPNLLIFRPLALMTDLHDGLVSYQLNPLNADNPEASLKDAEKICSILSRILYHYDGWLGWDPEKLKDRPNIVFKVAASHPAAIDITIALNERGIGTNNTVTYTVAQELTLSMAEFEGMAKAIKKGILPSQVYQTNMQGRLEDHLREAEAEKLVMKLDDERFEKLVRRICPDATGSRQEKAKTLCSKKNLPSLTTDWFVEAMVEAFGEEMRERLEKLEEAIRKSGIYVTRRVYKLFFAPGVREKWISYLGEKFGLTQEQAETVFDRIDLLPASKRRADDTYLVLADSNMTNTEFPDQQLRVCEVAAQEGFDLSRYRNSVMEEPDLEMLKVALQIEDFRRAYEVAPSLKETLKKVGVDVEDLGEGGLEPEEWPSFGSVVKTMTQFKGAYVTFREKAVEFVKKG